MPFPTLSRHFGRALVTGGPPLSRFKDSLLTGISGNPARIDAVIVVRDRPSDIGPAESAATDGLESGILAGLERRGRRFPSSGSSAPTRTQRRSRCSIRRVSGRRWTARTSPRAGWRWPTRSPVRRATSASRPRRTACFRRSTSHALPPRSRGEARGPAAVRGGRRRLRRAVAQRHAPRRAGPPELPGPDGRLSRRRRARRLLADRPRPARACSTTARVSTSSIPSFAAGPSTCSGWRCSG